MSQLNFWSFGCFVGQNFIVSSHYIAVMLSFRIQLNNGIKYLMNIKILVNFVNQLFIVCN